MIINHNITAMNTNRQLALNNSSASKSLEKLSSGYRINRAGDDAAGLAISEKMRGQIRGLNQASRNAEDGISMIQTTEGALSETESILQRMKELATQAANGTNTTADRAEIQKEIDQLTSEINRIGNTTEFNTQKLLDGGGSTVTGKSVSTTTAGGAAGKIGSVQTITTSSTGKSMASFTANGYTVSIEANNASNNLAGKSIKFVADATAAAAVTVTDGGAGDITIHVHADSTIANIQTALNNSASFSGDGGVTLTVTNVSTGAVVADTTALSAGSTPTAAQLVTATGSTVAFSSGGGTESRGVYTFEVEDAFVNSGDTFKLKIATGSSPDGWAEITLTATQAGTNESTGALAGTFNIGADATERLSAEQQAANIVATLKDGSAWDIDSNGTKITDVYDITYNGSTIILTEKSALGPQASVRNGGFTATTAVASVNTYTHTSADMVEVGGSFIIDGEEIAVVDGTGEEDAANIAAGKAILRTDSEGNTAATQIDLLQEAINRNSNLNNKYLAQDNDAGVLTLTQKTGYESTAAPVMETSNKAGQKFTTTFQIGANSGQSISIEVSDMRALALKISGTTSEGTITASNGYVATLQATKSITNGTNNTNIEYSLDVSTYEKATAAISVLDDAISTVSAERSKLGAYQNRLEHTINNLGTSSENLTAAESRIRDVNMADEYTNYSKLNILSQAATAMLAQANQMPQTVLQLLR